MLGITIVIANGTELNWQAVTRIGLLIGFASAIFYSVNDLTKKETRGLINTTTAIFWSYFIAVPILILYLTLVGSGFSLVFSWPIVFLSVINFVALVLNFYALDSIDASVNRTISNLAPIFILLGLFLSSWILPDWVTILGVIIAIIGVGIINLSNSGKNIKPAPKINRNTIKLLVNSL